MVELKHVLLFSVHEREISTKIKCTDCNRIRGKYAITSSNNRISTYVAVALS